MKKFLAFALLGLAAASASAEKADAAKQAVIGYDSLETNEVTQITILTGNVVVTKGTLILKSDRATIKETPEGDMFVTLTAGAGKAATFRQKRDGGPDLWIEGQAQRIEYDERNDMMKLFSNARIRQLEGAKPTNEIESEFISYDSRKEVFLARNDASGTNKPGQGRGTMIIAPRKPRAAPATPAAGAPVTPAPAPAPAPTTTPAVITQ
ncbi:MULTISPECIES: lipopolysaccharide transport periplasmic protein LptA [Massilia]|uniref:Lipopolysaccharide export system protein LptA n=2 Tax=Massilia TaxID=149698 RepID=A0ABY4AEB0_9BURK|nr:MULTISPECIES: lipopolysaccharide transport periplasmic protein LptA [Massilia]NHZ40325.1 lipopolysaccharide transport periplasmic protein LptA [Massilia aquatica]UOD32722.1 lipopolysaccharide transport periplasmic protein LptA [Massilia violaceinigra]